MAVTAACGVLFGAACVAPARSPDAYRDKGATSAASSLSAVELGILTASVAEQGGLFTPQVGVLLAESEQAAETAASTFASIQPPDPSLDSYRGRLLAILHEASGALAALRIAARRGDLEALPMLARPLQALAVDLERFAGSQA